ncbi:holliday junction resolvase [Gordonia phage SpeedDemon]|uniref:Holliday junction resolvase n=1 Tax=Gordonia phage Bantam TaxID=1887641 RepID=A0A1B3AYE1_9CAUD|nr:hypothetical protein BIZ77_gp107 [Gordonia phage Bantam]AOE43761.1 hypothetical protein SEA_BANTAM_72 [Gordonia phage Bantam]QNL30524.1 holliday junction resolvase [Gordonia phage SpeedDemon]
MANPNKAKGDRYERDVLAVAIEAGFDEARRTRPGRVEDQGDIHLQRAALDILQTKDVASPNWREFLDGLADQKDRAQAETAALVVKRRGVGGRPALHLAVLHLDDYLRLIRRLRTMEEDLW